MKTRLESAHERERGWPAEGAAHAGSPYRDELRAAHLRIATLQEELAAAHRGQEAVAEDQRLARLLERRRRLARTARQRGRRRVCVLLGLVPLLAPAAATLEPPGHWPLAGATAGCAAVGALLAWALRASAQTAARRALPELDAKIADARRALALARRFRGVAPAHGARPVDALRARVAIDVGRGDDGAADGGGDRAELVQRERARPPEVHRKV